MSNTVRVFVAATSGEWLPMRVLEFSIREATTLAVEVSSIASFHRVIPFPRDLCNQLRTPFSFQRFLIPELCGYQGRAIYLDADMQLFTDIGVLWSTPMGSYDLLTVSEGTQGRKGQYSVVLLDCERLHWRIDSIVQGLDEGRYSYEQLMYEMCVAENVGRTLDSSWNSLEKYEHGRTRLLHYTDMDTQPWVSLNNSLSSLWVDCLRRAMSSGFITRDELEREIVAGHVRPSLLAEIEDASISRSELRRLDLDFVAPYKAIRSGQSRPWLPWRGALKAYGIRKWHRLRERPGA